jgi:hypothetical protein
MELLSFSGSYAEWNEVGLFFLMHAVIRRVEGFSRYTLSPSALFIDLSPSQKKTVEAETNKTKT